jgi:hypothetical protein
MEIKTFLKKDIRLDKFHLWTLFALFWIGLGWLGLILALFGIFYNAIIALYILIGITALIYAFAFNKNSIQLNYSNFFLFFISLIAIFVFSYYTTPSVFSGRDEGSLSLSAIELSQNHKLAFSSPASQEFFKIYGPGTALNFPGFSYTTRGELTTQFPLGYISWLAIFYSIFGLNGFIVANSITFLIFLSAFYLLTRYFVRQESAIVGLLIVLTSFVFSWFFKFTLSENLALTLLWFGIFEFILFTKNRNRFYLTSALLSLGLLTFARIEALAFLAIIFIILLFKYRDWKYVLFIIIGQKVIALLASMGLIYLLNIAVESNFYIALIKGFIRPFQSFSQDIQNSTGFIDAFVYVMKIFIAYGLFAYLLFGTITIIYLLKKKNFKVLIPFLITSPSLIYLINPSISIDHPWMLRRFLFSIVPMAIFYTIWAMDTFIKKRIYFYLIAVFLLGTNLLTFLPYLTFSPNKNLLPKIEKISENFDASDLVLVDQMATGDGWSMMAGPLNFLNGKQAVYFFNPKDLNKLNLKKWNAIYFIIPDNNLAIYRKSGLFSRMRPVKEYSIEVPSLKILRLDKKDAFSSEISLPEKQTTTVYGKIYLLIK